MHQQLDLGVDAISIDWRISMKTARRIAGPNTVLAGNIDPIVLYGTDQLICTAVGDVIKAAGKEKYVLNLGHGVEKDTPESAVQTFVAAAKECTAKQ